MFPGLPQYGDSYLKVVAEPVPSPSLDPCAELLFSAYAPYIGLAEATCRSSLRVAAMVLIHNMDSDEEQLQIVSYEEPEAYAATSHSENRMGIKMTPEVPPQFDGQSSWFEYEDLIDDWSGITILDADKHGPSLKNALIGSASFYKSILDNALLRDPDRGLAHFKDTLRPYFVKGVNHVFLWLLGPIC